MPNDALWQPKYIVLDASTVLANLGFMSDRAASLRDYCQRHNASVVVPWVVRREVENKIESEVRRHAKELARYGGLPAPESSSESLISEANARFVQGLNSLEAAEQPLPSIRHEDVVERILARERPFDTKGDRGYRDFLIWRSVLALGAPTAFVTSDKDFFRGEVLHPDLVADIERRGSDVRIFKGLDRFINDIVMQIGVTGDVSPASVDLGGLQLFAQRELNPRDVADLLWWDDVVVWLALFRNGRMVEPKDVADPEFTVPSIDGVRLVGLPKKQTKSGDAHCVTYMCSIRCTISGILTLDEGEVVTGTTSVDLPATLRYEFPAHGDKVIPTGVSLESIDLS